MGFQEGKANGAICRFARHVGEERYQRDGSDEKREEKKSVDRLPHVCGDCKHWDQFKLRCPQSRGVNGRTLRRGRARARVRKGNRKVPPLRGVRTASSTREQLIY